MKLKDANYKGHWNILVFCDQWTLMSDLNMSHYLKLSDFISFPLFGFTEVIKLRNFDFENHWSTWIFFDKKDRMLDLNLPHGKMSGIVSFTLFGFILVINLRNFGFESHVNTLMFFDKKCQIWVCPVKQCLIWYKLRCLSRILAISWEK